MTDLTGRYQTIDEINNLINIFKNCFDRVRESRRSHQNIDTFI